MTEATASLKKIDDRRPQEVPKVEERAKPIIEERESVVVVSEVTSEDTAPDFSVETRVDRAQVTSETLQEVSVVETKAQETKRMEVKQKRAKKVKAEKIQEDVTVMEIVERQKEHIAREVDEMMELLDAKEFGPGESPLRELATIGYLVRQGVSVNEINESLYRTEMFPALKTPDAQNALVQLVERKGHGPLISQVLTEETTTDESFVAATVGFRAFMRMVELQHATVEEVITHFAPEDFRPRAWEATEISEVREQPHLEIANEIHVETLPFLISFLIRSRPNSALRKEWMSFTKRKSISWVSRDSKLFLRKERLESSSRETYEILTSQQSPFQVSD